MSRSLPEIFQRRGIYYGYVVLAVGTVGVIASVPGQTMGVSVYTEHLIEALGVSRLSLSLMYLFGTLSSAFMLPLAGRLLDRRGSRFLAVIAGCGLALFLTALSYVDQITHQLAQCFQALASYASLIVLFICFFGIRHFGQGQLTMASRTMMSRWFEKKRGLMLGISGTFVAFAFGVTPYVINQLITGFGWRGSLHVLAGVLLGFALLAYLFFRRSPEHYNIAVDGAKVSQDENDTLREDAHTTNFTDKEAKKTFTFWVFNLGAAGQALLMTAVTFHIADIGFEAGLTSEKAFQIFIPISVVAVISELVAGYCSDRLALKYILCVMQASLAMSLLGLQSFGTDLGFMVTALGMGISSGIFSLLTAAAWPKLFGRLHLGAIMGVVTAWMVGASAMGPYMFSQGKVFSGSYQLILYVALVMPVSVMIASFFTTNPRKKAASLPH